MDEEYIKKLMEAHKDKNFVQRILSPNDFPYMDVGGGYKASHQMAWGESDGKYFVYPTIVQDPNTGELSKLDNDQAFDYALQTGEYFEFDDADSADFVSQKYKMLWEDEAVGEEDVNSRILHKMESEKLKPSKFLNK